MPAVRESEMYFSMTSVSGWHRLYKWLNGTVIGAVRRKGESCPFTELLPKIMIFLWYGRQVWRVRGMSSNSWSQWELNGLGLGLVWQVVLQLTILPVLQSIWGLCKDSQGCPKTSGESGELAMKKRINSWWLSETMSLTGIDCWVIE